MKPKTEILLNELILFPVYEYPIRVVVAKDSAALRTAMKEMFGSAYTYPSGEIIGCHLYDDGLSAVFIHAEHLKHAVVAHELEHARNRMLHNRGVKYDPENQEPFTYPIGWITQQFYDLCKRKKLKVR